MSDRFAPTDAAQVLEVVASAAAAETPLEVVGAGSKRALGRPVQTNHRLELSGLSGIELYEPAELVMTARPGTTMAAIEAELQGHGQQLAFEPPDLGPLLGGAPADNTIGGTIGGAIACNLAGPRRPKAGAARDHFLGVEAVTGRGEAIKAGGRVVKNVTGYDLCKLFAGSYGTLAVMTSVTVKVMPAPEKTRTVLVADLNDHDAGRAMTTALTSPHEVSAAAHLPAAVAARSGVSYVSGAGGAVTALRVEGPAPSAEHRCRALRELLSGCGDIEELHGHNSGALWCEVGNVTPFTGQPDRVVWRLSVPPTAGATVAASILANADGDVFYDWGGGLVWLSLVDDHGATVRAAVAETGGHATLVVADTARRDALAVFEPQEPGLAALSARIKDSFDPRRILNPGRMYPGV
ncbi:MAG: glycolate oxidase subunit GlcE [Pseudomonadota bacterium]|nr:glycolate oxidase subunit GlcE [Pseudomonadota bacterium]